MEQQPFIDFFGRFVRFKLAHPETWVESCADFFMEEARRKWKRFPAFCKAFKRAFETLPSFRDGGIVEGAKPSITAFFLKDFFPLVQGWFRLTAGIAPSSMSLRDARIVYRGEAMYLVQVAISSRTFKALDEDIFDLGKLAEPMHVRAMIHFIFDKLIASLNPILRTVANIEWQLVQLTNLLEIVLDGTRVTMLVSFNDYSPKNLQTAYFNGHLLDFVQDTLGAEVSPKTKKDLLQRQQEFQDLARQTFTCRQDDVIGAIKHFEAKAIITGRIDPLYEPLAAIISKLDLGITPVQQLLREYNGSKGLTEHEEVLWGYLFELVMTQALLYGTFQSNLAIFKEEASQVFMIVLQYFLIDLGRDALSEKVYRGNLLHDKIASLVDPGDGGVRIAPDTPSPLDVFTRDFQQFLVNHFKVQDMDGYHGFIKCLFGRSVERLTSRFFSAFLKTGHEQVVASIETLNVNVPAAHRMTYEGLVRRISDFLQFCLNRVFFKGSLAQASRQFKDPVSRFSENNIATAIVEILMYRELPFHENQWMATLAVEYRNKVDVATVVDVRDRLKAISPAMLANYTIHDRALKQTTTLLHERFFTEIIEPFHDFHVFLRRDVHSKPLDWIGFVDAVSRFFTHKASPCNLDALGAENIARIVASLIDWQAP